MKNALGLRLRRLLNDSPVSRGDCRFSPSFAIDEDIGSLLMLSSSLTMKA
jgi:hypothetical protein